MTQEDYRGVIQENNILDGGTAAGGRGFGDKRQFSIKVKGVES